jgi:transcriptional regulator of acetoin/glycerol metabolism
MSQNPSRFAGQPPGGEVIQASWNRCVQEYGLDATMRRDVERVTDQNIRELRSHTCGMSRVTPTTACC